MGEGVWLNLLIKDWLMLKLIKTKRNKRSGWLYLTHFCKKYLQTLKCIVKKVCDFHLILDGNLSILILSVTNGRRGGERGEVRKFLLKRQNLLRMAKFHICWQFLTSKNLSMENNLQWLAVECKLFEHLDLVRSE